MDEMDIRILASELENELFDKYNTLTDFISYWEGKDYIACALATAQELNQNELQYIIDFSKKHNLRANVVFDEEDGLCIEIRAKKED